MRYVFQELVQAVDVSRHSTMSLQELVQAFNALPRTQKVATGLADNHWQFFVTHVPLFPPGDLLHIVHPKVYYSKTEGPAHILSLESVAARADVILPLLLKAFIMDERIGAAPWSWGTENEELATALVKAMTAARVRNELCRITTRDHESIQHEKELWATFLSGPKCSFCKRLRKPGGPRHPVCPVCLVSKYCSIDCQKADWEEHKVVCEFDASNPSIDALDFYLFCTRLPEANALARDIGLVLPG